MTPLVRRFWVFYQLAALPLAVFCWFATLFWLAMIVLHSTDSSPGFAASIPTSEILAAAGFWSFGAIYWIGLWRGHRLPPRLLWIPLVVHLPWLIGFLVHQFDEDWSVPGDGLLPPGFQGPPTMAYLALLLALLATNLIVAIAAAFETPRQEAGPGR